MKPHEKLTQAVEALQRIRGRDHALAVVRSYSSRLPATLADLRDALDRRDREGARVITRTLRDRSEELGLTRMAMMSQMLDGWAGVAAWVDARETLELLEREVLECQPALVEIARRT